MAFILFLCIFLTSRMEKVPKGKQAIAEKIVLMIDNLVDQNMGPDSRIYSPYIATLMMSSVFGSLCSLFTLRSVTADLNTTLGWALITFAMITYTKIKYGGLGGYLKSFTEPIFVMVPLNILSEIATPVSMSFRHFGNIAPANPAASDRYPGHYQPVFRSVLGLYPGVHLQYVDDGVCWFGKGITKPKKETKFRRKILWIPKHS